MVEVLAAPAAAVIVQEAGSTCATGVAPYFKLTPLKVVKLPDVLVPSCNTNLEVAAPGSGIVITDDWPIVPLAIVVLNAPPAFPAAIINVPLAAVAGKDIKVPASPDEPEVMLPAVAVILVPAVMLVVAEIAPVTARVCPRVVVVVAALMFPEVSENTAKAFAVDAPPENDTPPADGSALNTIASTPSTWGRGSTRV